MYFLHKTSKVCFSICQKSFLSLICMANVLLSIVTSTDLAVVILSFITEKAGHCGQLLLFWEGRKG